MEYRQLGESDLKVSAITFGAWAIGGWMWGGTERKDAVEAIRASIGEGVTSIDTAPIYGQGLSEEITGEALKGMDRSKVQILTKFGMRWDLEKGALAFKSKDNDGKDINIHRYAGKESIILECENSLKRLGTDYIDLYQIHWPDETTPIEETFEAVLRLKEQGKIREAGVCNYNAELMKKAEKVMKLASNQVPFSMVERGIEQELVPYCIENKKGILAYSPLQRGILSGKIKPGYHFEAGDHRPATKFYQPENLQRINAFLDEIRPVAESKSVTLAQLVIRWTIDRPGITVALVGARNAEQAIQNAKAINIKLGSEEIKYINDRLYKLEII
ncbi:Predicted oxidoreductase [Chitinophaga sp. CF118]|uniref:aldo/keto reductase n=1 Tax=Chitinophaga sp. CF118 TaxID=1884367 RepID=UPI0008EDB811|nr:aldo/keto reductase [Chitinophaga sp. CF118]SFD51872.1 Predicted oxidoreductase [Chitinophaga sp. CF118]